MLTILNHDMLLYISEYITDIIPFRHTCSATLIIRYNRRISRRIYIKIPIELYLYSFTTLIPLYTMLGDNPLILINPLLCIYFIHVNRSYILEYMYV